MKKSLIALAVAGVVSAPAFAASSNVDVYGQVRMSIDSVKAGDVAAGGNNDGWLMSDRVSRIGFKGAEDLGGGMKGIWQIESGLTVDGAGALGGAALRNTFVGLAGGFGTVVLGRHDTPYKLAGSADLFGDTIADSQAAGVAAVNGSTGGIIGRNGFDTRAAATLAYITPDFSGFHAAAAIVAGEENVGGAGAATAVANNARGLMDIYSLAGIYKNGPLNASVGFEKANAKVGVAALPAGTVATAIDALKLNVGYTMGDIKLGYTYERSDDQNFTSAANPQKSDKGHLLSAAYGMGPITLKAQYGKFDDQANGAAQAANDLTRWVIGADYALSKRTGVYALYMNDNYKLANDVASGQNGIAAVRDTKALSVGINHSF
jgi:predicted porin